MLGENKNLIASNLALFFTFIKWGWGRGVGVKYFPSALIE